MSDLDELKKRLEKLEKFVGVGRMDIEVWDEYGNCQVIGMYKDDTISDLANKLNDRSDLTCVIWLGSKIINNNEYDQTLDEAGLTDGCEIRYELMNDRQYTSMMRNS